MMTSNRNESIVLTITRNENDMTIRIDKNGLAYSQFEGLPIVELKMKGCREATRVSDNLLNPIGQPLEYNVLKGEDEFTVLLRVNYAPDELEVKCNQVHEV